MSVKKELHRICINDDKYADLHDWEKLFSWCYQWWHPLQQYIPRNMHTVFALLCFVVVIHWLVFPYPSGLLHWHCGNLTIAPVPAKQPWWIWINTSCEFIMNDCITTTKQSTTKPCAYFLGYTVVIHPPQPCRLTLHSSATVNWWELLCSPTRWLTIRLPSLGIGLSSGIIGLLGFMEYCCN